MYNFLKATVLFPIYYLCWIQNGNEAIHICPSFQTLVSEYKAVSYNLHLVDGFLLYIDV